MNPAQSIGLFLGTLSQRPRKLSAAWSRVTGTWLFLRWIGNSTYLIIAIFFFCTWKSGSWFKEQLWEGVSVPCDALTEGQRGHLMATPGATGQGLGNDTQAEWEHVHPGKAKGRWRRISRSGHSFFWSFFLTCLTTLNLNCLWASPGPWLSTEMSFLWTQTLS